MRTCGVVWQVSMQVAGSLNDVVVDTQRRKHLAYLMADHGTIVNPEASRNLPKQVLYSALTIIIIIVFYIIPWEHGNSHRKYTERTLKDAIKLN